MAPRLEIETVLDDRPDDRGRVFRPQGQRPAALVGERVHFLDHDVRGLAGALLEELGGFENGGPELAVAVELESSPGGRPRRLCQDLDFPGQDVLGALDGGQLFFGGASSVSLFDEDPQLPDFLVALGDELGGRLVLDLLQGLMEMLVDVLECLLRVDMGPAGRLGDDLVDDAELEEGGRADPEALGRLLDRVLVLPEDGGASLGRDDRVEGSIRAS